MTFKCKIGLHSWDGCKCSECGKTRDEQHDWSKDCENCSICGKYEKDDHDWTENCEKCKWCDQTRENQHDWSKDCEKCSKCGKTREDAHAWSGVKCSKCSKTRDEHSDSKKNIPNQIIQEPTMLLITSLPEKCFDQAPLNNDDFLAHYTNFLPRLFNQISDSGSDPIMMLIAFDQEMWMALLALLYKQPAKIFLSPETYTKEKVQIESNGYCDVYVPPTFKGKTLKTGLYALDREFLFSQLCFLKGLPSFFLTSVKEDKKVDHFPIVVFNSNGMCVRHLPLLNTQQAVSTIPPHVGSGTNADIKAKSMYKGVALMEAARIGDSTKVRTMIAAGADMNARDKEGTALMYVAAKCDTESVQAMIAGGADVNAENNNWGTPLKLAAKQGNLDSAKALMTAGANVNAKDEYATILMSVVGNYGFEFYANIEAFNAIVHELIDAGADVNAKNNSGATALMWAAGKRKGLEQVKMLIASGADVDAKDNKGWSALMYAAKGDSETSEALKMAGASLSPSEADILKNQPEESQEMRFDIPRVSIPASTLKTRLSAGMSIDEVHRILGEPHQKNRWALLRCDNHEVWITIDGQLRVFYSMDKKVEKWAVES